MLFSLEAARMLPEYFADCLKHHFVAESSFRGLAEQSSVCGETTVIPKHDGGTAELVSRGQPRPAARFRPWLPCSEVPSALNLGQ